MYENLNKELKSALNNVGIEFDTLNVRAKHDSKKINKHYSNYYKSNEEIELIAEKYAQEIELFGYTFEDKREG